MGAQSGIDRSLGMLGFPVVVMANYMLVVVRRTAVAQVVRANFLAADKLRNVFDLVVKVVVGRNQGFAGRRAWRVGIDGLVNGSGKLEGSVGHDA